MEQVDEIMVLRQEIAWLREEILWLREELDRRPPIGYIEWRRFNQHPLPSPEIICGQ